MTNFPSYYLEELLKSYGEVRAAKEIAGKVRQIDVWFSPDPQQSSDLTTLLGLLGTLAQHPAIFEPFRNAASVEEICNCVLKSLEVRGILQREAKRNKIPLEISIIPKLWILTPTASPKNLLGFGAEPKEPWLSGVYFLPSNFCAAIVVIHQLPRIPETLWLRILGRGRVQRQAVDELEALPTEHPFKQATLELLYNLQRNLVVNQELEKDDRELIMRLAPLYQQEKEQAIQEAIQQAVQQYQQEIVQAVQQGIQREQQLIIRLLNRQIGELDAGLIAQISGLSIERLESLGEALLDFSSVADLLSWLMQQETR